MMERRRHRRVKPRGRVWVAAPYRCWAAIRDASDGGLAIVVPRSMRTGSRVIVYRSVGNGLGPGRLSTVQHAHGDHVGIAYDREESAERRGALRHATRSLSARISGAVATLATVLDLSASGAAIEPLLPLRRGARLTIELLHRDTVILKRDALVVRTDPVSVGLCFAI